MSQAPKKTSAVTMPHIENAAELEKEFQEKLNSHLSAQKTATKRAAKFKHQQERAGALNNIAANKDEGGRKKESDFAVLFRTLVDAPSIASYVSQQHNNDLRNIKSMNNFLQSISQRPKELYESLFANHKAEVSVILERLLDCLQGRGATVGGNATAAQKVAGKEAAVMTPAAHEFVIRAKKVLERRRGKPTWCLCPMPFKAL